jgi:probable phosphoglycerate mutase
MEIVFARHGNTFNPGDKVVWVGRETDLPLVEKGLAQAAAAAEVLARVRLVPDVIYAASLKRTKRFAEIIAETLGLAAPIIDRRLDELDYGAWAGRTNEEIAQGGPLAQSAMDEWNRSDAWPAVAGWVSQEADVLDAVRRFAIERLASGDHVRPLVVSSNGILRFLPRALLAPQIQRDSFKMKTGHLGVIDCENGDASLRYWDVAPADLRDPT